MIEVLSPGLLTTVQDGGRFGHGDWGISPGGAADALALRLANRLVGNSAGSAALEATLLGPGLRFEHGALVAIAGADLGALIDGATAPLGEAIEIAAGSELSFRGGAGGARTCIAVAGGVDVPEILGSRSTDLRGGFGGVEGRALRRGDRLTIGAAQGRPRAVTADLRDRLFARRDTLRVVPGADRERFSAEAARRLVGEPFAVRPDSDRMGVRLDGARLDLVAPWEKQSEGAVAGVVQVPASGSPIVLGVDHPATGGYAQIAAVIAADLPSLAQLRPRQPVRFEWVDFAAALEALRDTEQLLAALDSD